MVVKHSGQVYTEKYNLIIWLSLYVLLNQNKIDSFKRLDQNETNMIL